eukprot:SAG11_NODE_4453_length_1889_cov_2.757542_2_plen_204_part_00
MEWGVQSFLQLHTRARLTTMESAFVDNKQTFTIPTPSPPTIPTPSPSTRPPHSTSKKARTASSNHSRQQENEREVGEEVTLESAWVAHENAELAQCDLRTVDLPVGTVITVETAYSTFFEVSASQEDNNFFVLDYIVRGVAKDSLSHSCEGLTLALLRRTHSRTTTTLRRRATPGWSTSSWRNHTMRSARPCLRRTARRRIRC